MKNLENKLGQLAKQIAKQSNRDCSYNTMEFKETKALELDAITIKT